MSSKEREARNTIQAETGRITRRQFIKDTAAATAILGAGSSLLFGCVRGCSNPPDVFPGEKETRHLHFNLYDEPSDINYHLHVGASTYQLIPHDDKSRIEHRGRNSYLKTITDGQLTHYVADVDSFPLHASAGLYCCA
jgi:hypothetical protein